LILRYLRFRETVPVQTCLTRHAKVEKKFSNQYFPRKHSHKERLQIQTFLIQVLFALVLRSSFFAKKSKLFQVMNLIYLLLWMNNKQIYLWRNNINILFQTCLYFQSEYIIRFIFMKTAAQVFQSKAKMPQQVW
jgi:hypothetical protein